MKNSLRQANIQQEKLHGGLAKTRATHCEQHLTIAARTVYSLSRQQLAVLLDSSGRMSTHSSLYITEKVLHERSGLCTTYIFDWPSTEALDIAVPDRACACVGGLFSTGGGDSLHLRQATGLERTRLTGRSTG